jgi:DNA-binding FadR family transcriptional regulator
MTTRFDLSRTFRDRIVSGEWPEGSQLPTERELAAEYTVARNTVRRALHDLVADGLLTRHVGRGTFVRDNCATTSDPFLAQLRGASPSDLLETRLIIEPTAAALAAGRATRSDLIAINEALEGSLAVRDVKGFEMWDAQLHLAIFQAAKNEVLILYCRAISEVRNQPKWFQLKKRSLSPDRMTLYDEHHRMIVAAITESDARAAVDAMREHLQVVQDNILSVG